LSRPSSGPARSRGPRFAAVANPRGVAVRYRVFVERRSSWCIGSQPPACASNPSELCASRYSLSAHAARRDPSCVPLLRFCSPSGLSPEGPARRLAARAPLVGISCRSAHPFRRSPHNPVRPTARVRVRVQGFSTSSRFAPPSASRVYFTPLTPFGFTLQGLPLSESRDSSSLPLLPSCRFSVGSAPAA
jgi:hypothetical protein